MVKDGEWSGKFAVIVISSSSAFFDRDHCRLFLVAKDQNGGGILYLTMLNVG